MNSLTDAMSSSYSLPESNIFTVSVGDMGNTDYNPRILPRQLSTGSTRGTQTVGYGDVKIDGSNDQILLGSTTDSNGKQQQAIIGQLNPADSLDQSFGIKVVDKSGAEIFFGILPDGNLGIQLNDADGNEVMRSGYFPISQIYGWAAATPGNTLEGQV